MTFAFAFAFALAFVCVPLALCWLRSMDWGDVALAFFGVPIAGFLGVLCFGAIGDLIIYVKRGRH